MVLQYDLLDSETNVQRVVPCVFFIVSMIYCTTRMITVLRYCTTDSGSFQCDVERNQDGGSLSDNPDTGEDSSTCSSWIRLLIVRNNYSRSRARKLGGGGWEREN